jgi:hypothetical protein
MNTKFRPSKMSAVKRRKVGVGRCVVGVSLLAAALRAHAADLKPEQQFEGGTNSYDNWLELSTGGMITQGNSSQAVQRERLNVGPFGGIEDFHYQTEVAKKTTFTIDGRAIADNNDYKLGLKLEKEDLGYIRFYFENFRTWEAGDGGLSPVDRLSYQFPNNALGLDRGQVSLEAGYNKEGKPKITFKYHHSYRNGQESTTLWGPIQDSVQNVYRVYPNVYDIDEASDSFQLDVQQEIKKTQVGVGMSFEFGKINDAHELAFFPGESAQQDVTDRQETTYDMFNVHASTETWFKDKYFLSTGFSFANLDDTFTGSRIYGDDFDVVYSSSYPANYYGYYDLNGGAHKHDYVMNVNFMALPAKDFTITPSLRVQKEDWNANSSEAATGVSTGVGTDSGLGAFNNNSGEDSIDVRERLEARYTGITNWVYTATADWTEGQGNLNENGGIATTQMGGAPDGANPINFRMDDSSFFQKYGVNARWYPIRQATLDVGGYYKMNRYDYDFSQDNSAPYSPAPGTDYPAFLTYQGFNTWDGNVRLTLRPLNKVTLVSRYEYQDSTITTQPDPASGLTEIDSSHMYSHILGQNATWVPLNWLCLQAGFNYVLSTTETPASSLSLSTGTQSATITQNILNSQNNYWTVNFNSTFVLDEKTDLNIGYYYYRAADSQNGLLVGVPLGADTEEHSVTATLSRRITKNLRWNLRYAFTHYDDMASLGSYNFDAHVIFSSLQYRF